MFIYLDINFSPIKSSDKPILTESLHGDSGAFMDSTSFATVPPWFVLFYKKKLTHIFWLGNASIMVKTNFMLGPV